MNNKNLLTIFLKDILKSNVNKSLKLQAKFFLDELEKEMREIDERLNNKPNYTPFQWDSFDIEGFKTIVSFLKEKKFISAIKVLRELTGLNLAESKWHIEQLSDLFLQKEKYEE